MNKTISIIPLLALIALAYMAMSQSLDVPSTKMIGSPVPDFEMHEFTMGGMSQNILTRSSLPSDVIMINIFASWCPTCAIEHDVLMSLSQKGVRIYGLAFDDTENDLRGMLAKEGNPYEKIGLPPPVYDYKNWNLKGTPESFIIDSSGIIRHRHRGPLTEEDAKNKILPLIERLKK